MQRVFNMTVGARLLLAFLFIALVGAAVGAVGIRSMSRIDDMTDAMYLNELRGLAYIKEANIDLIAIGRARGNFLLATTGAERDRQKANIEKLSAAVIANLGKAKPLFVSDKAKEIFAGLDTHWQGYQQTMAQALALAGDDNVDRDTLAQVLAGVLERANALEALFAELTAQKEARARQAMEDSKAIYAGSRNAMIVLIVLSAAAAVAIGMLITRSLVRQLGGEPAEVADIANRIARGDLTVAVHVRADDRSSVVHAMKLMRESLVDILTRVRDATDAVSSASAQIASGNADLSSRTEEQGSSLEETASSMEELTSTVRQNAENARQANELASTASGVAVKGGEVVGDVVSTMSSINDSSKKIADIISVIDGIAFQTNILALNAAVEAARAGEQGRGFAVVASEVRSLAQRSAGAAKEIKALITDSVSKVESGSHLVEQAGMTMSEIVDAVKRVTDIMADIAAASAEQSSGIEQVNQAITQMDEATQQNAALVEEAAAAAESLQDQAKALSEAVAVFKLEKNAPAPHSGVPARAPATVTPLVKAKAESADSGTMKAQAAAGPARKASRKIANAPGSTDEWTEF